MSSSWNFHSSIYKYLPLCCNVNAIKHHRHTRIAIFYCSVSLLLCIYLNKSIEGFAKAGDMFHPGDHLLLCDVSPDEKESPLVSPPQNWEGGEPGWNEGRFGPSCWKSWISDPRLPLPLPPLEPSSSPVERKVTNRLIQNINRTTSQLKNVPRENHLQWKNNIFGSNVKAWMIADVPESWVWWRADFQSGSRVLKKVYWTFS